VVRFVVDLGLDAMRSMPRAELTRRAIKAGSESLGEDEPSTEEANEAEAATGPGAPRTNPPAARHRGGRRLR
jgi:hypothetical protein